MTNQTLFCHFLTMHSCWPAAADGAMGTAAFMLAIVSAMASDEGSSINASTGTKIWH